MKKILKNTLLSSLALAPLASMPLIAAACKKTPQNSGYQKALIKKQLTQNAVMNKLTSGILNEIYADDVKVNTSTAQNLPEDRIKDALSNKNSQIWKDFYKIFKVYARKKLATDKQFFSKLKNTFAELQVDVTSFSPAPFNLPSEEETQFIVKNAHLLTDNIRVEIQKFLLVYNYLIKAREELRKIANNADGEDKVKKALKTDKKSMTDSQKELHEALNWKGNDLYLIEALMNDPIVQSWEFKDNRDVELRRTLGQIRTANQFNKLAGYNPNDAPQYKVNEAAKDWEKELTLLNSGVKQGTSDIAELLRGYKGIIKNSGFSGRDMETNISAIKEQKSNIFGFIDPKNNKIYGPNEFAFGDLIAKMQKRPTAKIKDEFKDKIKSGEIKKIEAKHLSVTYWDPETSSNKDATFDDKTSQFSATFKIKEVDDNGQPTTADKEITVYYEVNKIKHDTSTIGDITVEWKLSTKELSKRNFYEFQTRLLSNKDWVDEHKDSPLELPTSLYPTTVNLVKDEKEFIGKFVMKISPLYLEKGTTGKKLTLEDTPWSSDDQKSRIAYNIMFLNEKDYFKKAILYYKELKLYSINEKNLHTEIRDMLRQIGIL